RNGVDGFGDHHSADQQPHAEADHGDDGYGGVGQGVPDQHLGFGLALGAGGADIVLVHDLEHTRARDAGDQGDKDHGQRNRGQEQPLQPAADALGKTLVALHRQPVEFDGEDVDQDIGDHEHRHREAEHREAHHSAVEPATVSVGRQHAERYGDGDGDDDRQ